jgi:4-diphosphocytidyl-2C-methyl-D-erythritol kinase
VDLGGPRHDPGPLLAALVSRETDIEPTELPEPFNRLAEAAFLVEPELRALRARIARAAGRQAYLSGSGSGFFLLCDDDGDACETAAHVRDATHLPVCVTASCAQGGAPASEFLPEEEDSR